MSNQFNNMKNKIIFTIFAVFFFCLFINPLKVRATCDISAIQNEYSARGLSGSGIEQQAIDSCLSQQRQQNQQVRDQQLLQQRNYSDSPEQNALQTWQLLEQQSKAQQSQQNSMQNSMLESQLKAQYGVSKYYTCYSQSSSSCGINNLNVGDSYAVSEAAANCTSAIQMCLELGAMHPSSVPIQPSGTLCNLPRLL